MRGTTLASSGARGWLASEYAVAALLALGSACAGGEGPANDEASDTEAGGDETQADSDVAPDLDDGTVPGANTRYFRLTHAQWENTVQDLFWLAEPSGLSASFRSDPFEAGYIFENSALGLEIDGALWNGYRAAAVAVAEVAVTDPGLHDALLPVDGGDPSVLADAFIAEFGRRAFRRPLAADELTRYRELFDQGGALYDDMDGFDAGMRVVIEAMLQSPHFLYRIENSQDVADEAIPLDGYELASRLSYFFWDSMPDERLFEAAASGVLLTRGGIEAEARRMLEDPRTDTMVRRFHEVLFRVSKFEAIRPSAAFFPDAPEDLGALATEEFRRFVVDGIFAADLGLFDMLLTNQSFVNAELAAIYGVEGDFGEAFEPVELPLNERRGILTQIGFLASNATSAQPDAIHRGVFALERLTCTHVPPPPNDIPPLPAVDGQTNRQAIEDLTESRSPCVSCHKGLINPYGFAFESYDAIGAVRYFDNGLPVDTSTTILLDGERIPVDDPFELIDALAVSPSVHRCYARHWVEFANGRGATDEDELLIDRLGEASLSSRLSMKALLVELVTSQSFRTRSTEELAQ